MRWTTQPPAGTPLDKNHPLYPNIAYVKNFADIHSPELVKGIRPTVVDFLQRPGYMDTTGSTGDYYDSKTSFNVSNLTAPTNLVSSFQIVRTTDQTATLWGMRTNATCVVQSATVAGGWGCVVGSESTIHDDSPTAMWDGEWHNLGQSIEIGTEATGYIDGIPGGNGTVATTNNGSDAAINLSIGQRWTTYPSTTYTGDLDTRLFILWVGRILTAEEHASLAKNPWQIFKPKPRFALADQPEDHLVVSAPKVVVAPPSKAVLLDDTTPDYIRYSFAPITTTPFTMAIWAYDDETALNDRCLMQIQDIDTDSNYFRMGIGNSGSPTSLPPMCFVSGGADTLEHPLERPLNTWYHSCAVFAATNNRTIYHNGDGASASSTDANPSNLDSITIGREDDSSPGDEWSGGVLWPAVWKIPLSPGDVYKLSRGAHPLTIRPESLVFFAPFDGTADQFIDVVSNRGPSLIAGSPTLTTSPRGLEALSKLTHMMVNEDLPDLATFEKPWTEQPR